MHPADNIVTIRTTGAEGTTERRIDLNTVPNQIRNRVIHAAIHTAMLAGMCQIIPEEDCPHAQEALTELQDALAVLDLFDGHLDDATDEALAQSIQLLRARVMSITAHVNALERFKETRNRT